MMKIYLNTAMLMFRSLLIVFRKRRTKIVNKQPWGMSEIGITFSLYMEMKMQLATPMQQSAMMILSRNVLVVFMRMRMSGMLVASTSATATLQAAVVAVSNTVLASVPASSGSSTVVMVMGKQSGTQMDRFMAVDSSWLL